MIKSLSPPAISVSALVFLLLITSATYWVGLHGPFLLDDSNNLLVIQQWLAGQSSLQDVLTSTVASPYGRPVSMASLSLSAHLGGYTPFAFKLGNLIVHLACGTVVFSLIQRITTRDRRLQQNAAKVALLVAALWLLHPLNVSTVLYAVQRMAQLSTLFMLLGMWFYMMVRQRLEQGASYTALIGLFAVIPVLTVVGFLAKENALLLPALCLVLELGCFWHGYRPHAVKVFFWVALVLPTLGGMALFAQNPQRLLGAYVGRDFSWQERLLTECRALCDYLWKIALPNPPSMGVYTDDFTVSSGLLSPPSTLLAILALIGITLVAFKFRRAHSALFIGWGIYLVGHAIESTILPLELYFEHRNYLPMVGVLYALAGLATEVGERVLGQTQNRGRIGAMLGFGMVALFAFATHGRANVWGTEALLVESAVAAHPNSMRAQLAVVDVAVRHNNLPRAAIALDAMTRSDSAKVRAHGHLNRINLSCAFFHQADPQDLKSATRYAPKHISMDEVETFQLLFTNTETSCEGVSDITMARVATAFALNASTQPDTYIEKAMLRRIAANFHSRQGDWAGALPLAVQSWQPGMPPAASVTLIQAQLATGDLAGAERTWVEAVSRARPDDVEDAAGLRWLRRRIDAAWKSDGRRLP